MKMKWSEVKASRKGRSSGKTDDTLADSQTGRVGAHSGDRVKTRLHDKRDDTPASSKWVNQNVGVWLMCLAACLMMDVSLNMVI